MNTFKSKHLQGELGAAIYRFRGVLYAVGAFSFAVNVLLLTPSLYMLQVYDRVLTSRNSLTLLMLTLVLVGLLLLEASLEFVRSRVLVKASIALDLDLSPRIFDASFARYMEQGGGSPAQALGDFNSIRQFLTSQGLFAFFDAPWTPIYLAVIFLLSPWLGLFALVGALILLTMAYLTERYTSPLLADAGQAAMSANAYAASNMRNAEAVEAMGMLRQVRERWFQRQTRFLSLQAQASDRAASITGITRFFRFALQSVMLGLGALLVIENQMSSGGMIAATILLGRALAPVELGISTWRGFVSARTAYTRLSTLLDNHRARVGSLQLPRPTGAVTAENLVLGAPGKREPILKNISFKVPAGSMVAVIGPSASGKSTLARALVGVWGPMNGAVRLDGADVHKWDKSELGPWIGYLPQDVELFEGTVAENIARFGELDSEQIVAAARHAGMHELILRLPQGYDTPIGEGGAVLSGGQRQRIALARALYGNPVLIVLDEPNANLDEAGETALHHALNYLKETKRTVFIVTHRKNILDLADHIAILAGGTMQGVHTVEDFRKMLLAQTRGASGSTVSRLQAEPKK
jgi:ATP-binding cassette, subfamily C, bacterial exporter for protease/lipase